MYHHLFGEYMTYLVMHQNFSDRMANSVDPDQTAPKRVV